MIETFTLTGNSIPQNSIELTLPRLLLGVARKIVVKDKFSILPELDFDITFDGKRNTLIKTGFASIDPHLGIELGYNDLVFLRGGIGYLQYEMDVTGKEALSVQPNIGIGVKIKRIALDYALTDLGDASVALYSNIFSLKFALVKPEPILSAPRVFLLQFGRKRRTYVEVGLLPKVRLSRAQIKGGT